MHFKISQSGEFSVASSEAVAESTIRCTAAMNAHSQIVDPVIWLNKVAEIPREI